MIFDITNKNVAYEKACSELLGKSFSLFERIKKGGIGSTRLIIAETSEKLTFIDGISHKDEQANIEMRPKGIILHITSKLERYAWLIPYYKLHIYSSDFFSIHADGNFIQFHKDEYYKLNKSFFQKLRDEKIKVLNLGYYDG